jgi:hypothetical protein
MLIKNTITCFVYMNSLALSHWTVSSSGHFFIENTNVLSNDEPSEILGDNCCLCDVDIST